MGEGGGILYVLAGNSDVMFLILISLDARLLSLWSLVSTLVGSQPCSQLTTLSAWDII